MGDPGGVGDHDLLVGLDSLAAQEDEVVVWIYIAWYGVLVGVALGVLLVCSGIRDYWKRH